MKLATQEQLFATTGLTPNRTKVLHQRNQLALAFGRNRAYEDMMYLGVDNVGHFLTDALASIFTRDMAARLVRLHFDLWGEAVARADATPGEPVYFGIVEFVKPASKARSHLCLVADTDDPRTLARLAAAEPQAKGHVAIRAVGVNITGLLKDVRSAARKAGLDFSDPFLPPPDSAEFAKLFAPYVKARDRAIEQTRALTPAGRERLAQSNGELAREIAERNFIVGSAIH